MRTARLAARRAGGARGLATRAFAEMPGAGAVPAGGTTPELLCARTGRIDAAGLFPRLLDLAREGGRGSQFVVWTGGRPWVVVAEPSAVRQVLDPATAGDYAKGYDYDCSRVLIGDGVLSADGEAWRAARKALRPTFSPLEMRALPEVVARHLRFEGGPMNALAFSSRLFIRVTLDKFFGLRLGDAGADERRVAATLDAVELLVASMGARFAEAGAEGLPWQSGCPAHGGGARAAAPDAGPRTAEERDAYALLDALFEESAAAALAGPPEERGSTVLGKLLGAGDGAAAAAACPRARASARDQFMTLLLVGHDAGAAMFAFLADALARRPGVARRLQAEIDAALEARGAAVPPPPPLGGAPLLPYGAQAKLPYLAAVSKELLRLQAPAPGFGRYTLVDGELGGYEVPAGTMLMVCPYLTHRLPQLGWSDPDEFVPERFMVPRRECEARQSDNYLPFGYGPRNCLGQVAAVTEVKALLVELLARLDVVPSGDAGAFAPPEYAGLVARPRGGADVVWEPRR